MEHLAGEVEGFIEEKTENSEKWADSKKGLEWTAIFDFLTEQTDALAEIEGEELPTE